MTNVKPKENESIIEALLNKKEVPNGDVLDLYHDEEVFRLLQKYEQLKKELKAMEKTLKLVDEEAKKRLKRRKITQAKDDSIVITLVSYEQRRLDKSSLGEFLSKHGKSLEHFEEVKKVEYIKRRLL